MTWFRFGIASAIHGPIVHFTLVPAWSAALDVDQVAGVVDVGWSPVVERVAGCVDS